MKADTDQPVSYVKSVSLAVNSRTQSTAEGVSSTGSVTEKRVTWDEVVLEHGALHSSDPTDEATSHRRSQCSFHQIEGDYLPKCPAL